MKVRDANGRLWTAQGIEYPLRLAVAGLVNGGGIAPDHPLGWEF